MDIEPGIELLTRVLCDVVPASGADALHLFAQTEDNQHSVFRTTRRLRPDVPRVSILEAEACNGYPGFAAWSHALEQQGLPRRKIEGVPVEDPSALNTLVEAEALVRHARRRGYTSLAVAAAPFHQLRAFMTSVTVAARDYPQLRLYSRPGSALPWNETVRHSQGTLTQQRQALIGSEWERIRTYQQKGDLGSFRLVLNYLDERDEGPPPAP